MSEQDPRTQALFLIAENIVNGILRDAKDSSEPVSAGEIALIGILSGIQIHRAEPEIADRVLEAIAVGALRGAIAANVARSIGMFRDRLNGGSAG